MNKSAIVILTYNNLEYNKACLDSIRKYTEPGTYEIIVVDNNSIDGTRQWLAEQNDIKMALNDENVGFPKGCNIGIGLAEKDSDIMLLNNDTVVTTKWLENLQKCLYSNEKIGAAGSVSLSTANLQGVDFNYNNFQDMQVLAEKNNVSDSSKWEEKLKLIGFCLLIKREVLNKIGMLDESFSPGYYEDDDLSLRIVEAGYKLMLCHDSFIHHYLGTSFRKDQTKFYNLLNANQQKFTAKWGFTTHTFDELRGDLAGIVHEPNINKNLNILELGCRLGVNLLRLKYKYPNANLFGIESNKEVAKIAEKVVNLSRKTVGEFPLDFKKGYFHYIFIGNYLELVDDPVDFLKNIKEYLNKDGYIIAGVQNIMHFSVIKNLINGDWYYSQGDVVNKKNKLYLTGNDINRLFSDCGYINPYIFHWYSWVSEEDNKIIEKIIEIGGKDKEYLYRTYAYAIRFQNNGVNKEIERVKIEAKYLLRRIENGIDEANSLKELQEYINEDLISKDTIMEIIRKDIIQKENIINLIKDII